MTFFVFFDGPPSAFAAAACSFFYAFTYRQLERPGGMRLWQERRVKLVVLTIDHIFSILPVAVRLDARGSLPPGFVEGAGKGTSPRKGSQG